MFKRWMFAGFVALAAVSPSSALVAAQAPKVAPIKPPKTPRLDLSKMTLLKAGAGIRNGPGAALIGASKAIDPKLDRPNVRPSLSDVERSALRERLAAMIGVAVASVPVFKPSARLGAPGDTVVLALDSLPDTGAYIEAHHGRRVGRTSNGHGYIRLSGDDADAVKHPAVLVHTPVEPSALYLYTCFVTTDLQDLGVIVVDHRDGGPDNDYFTLPVTNGKLFVPFEVGDSTHALTLCLTRSDWARGESFVLSHCELTRVT